MSSPAGRLHVVVDAANVVGSRPDGWWRDRAAAAGRLLNAVAGAVAAGFPPPPVGIGEVGSSGPDGDAQQVEVVVVLEGAARPAAPPGPLAAAPAVQVIHASGAGDDEIARQAAAPLGGTTLVVTADRVLAARCRAAGAETTGPGWLWRWVR